MALNCEIKTTKRRRVHNINFYFKKFTTLYLKIVRNYTIQYISQFLDTAGTSFLSVHFFPSSPGRPSGGTNETKIKCKWKFIAPGDRRRFRTFKFFINFSSTSPLFFLYLSFLSQFFFSSLFPPRAE